MLFCFRCTSWVDNLLNKQHPVTCGENIDNKCDCNMKCWDTPSRCAAENWTTAWALAHYKTRLETSIGSFNKRTWIFFDSLKIHPCQIWQVLANNLMKKGSFYSLSSKGLRSMCLSIHCQHLGTKQIKWQKICKQYFPWLVCGILKNSSPNSLPSTFHNKVWRL